MEKFGWPLPKRREYLKGKQAEPSPETYPVSFQGKLMYLKVIRVPIELPKYRLANGRTQAAQREFLARNPEIPRDFFTRDLESEAAQEQQHKLLCELLGREDTNLLEYFDKHEQEQPLILTDNGFVLNGNRRLTAMRELFFGNGDKYKRFSHVTAVVLPASDERDLDQLEATLQVAKDIKADYSWVSFALMLKVRREEHNFSDADLRRLYDLSKQELDKYFDMLDYAEQYLQARGKSEQYMSVDKDRYAFEAIVDKRKKVRSPLRDAFVELAFREIDNPTGNRAYQTIRDIGDNMDKVAENLTEEIPHTAGVTTSEDELDAVLGGEGLNQNGLVGLIRETDNASAVKSIVRETIGAQKALRDEKKRSDFVLVQVRKANAALLNAIGGVSDLAKKDGIADQLELACKAVEKLRTWLRD